jgi:hypothetical protein
MENQLRCHRENEAQRLSRFLSRFFNFSAICFRRGSSARSACLSHAVCRLLANCGMSSPSISNHDCTFAVRFKTTFFELFMFSSDPVQSTELCVLRLQTI